MICLPPPLSPLVTHSPQMKAHQLIRRQRCLIFLVVHLGSFVNAPSVLVRFHKSHMFVLNTFYDLGVIVVLPQELLHLMWEVSFYHCHFSSLIHVNFHEIFFEIIFISMVCCGFLNVIGFLYDTTTLCSITRGFSCHKKCTFAGICCRDWYLS